MAITAAQVLAAVRRWNLEAAAAPAAERLATYGNLLLHWNTRISLTAIRTEEELIERHLMEGVFAAAHHPAAATALDFGSGSGIPGIPIAICRHDIRVTLAESQRKKAAFLQESIRQLGLEAKVHAGRAEDLLPDCFDTVWMRAVEKTSVMLPLAAALVAPRGSLCLLTTTEFISKAGTAVLGDWVWISRPFPDCNQRVLHIGTRK